MTTTTAPGSTPYRPSATKRAQLWVANHFAIISAILVMVFLYVRRFGTEELV